MTSRELLLTARGGWRGLSLAAWEPRGDAPTARAVSAAEVAEPRAPSRAARERGRSLPSWPQTERPVRPPLSRTGRQRSAEQADGAEPAEPVREQVRVQMLAVEERREVSAEPVVLVVAVALVAWFYPSLGFRTVMV